LASVLHIIIHVSDVNYQHRVYFSDLKLHVATAYQRKPATGIQKACQRNGS